MTEIALVEAQILSEAGAESPEEAMFRAVNAARAARGQRPLAHDRTLNAIAQARAKAMVDHDYFDHRGLNNVIPQRFQRWGENIAWRYTRKGHDIAGIVQAWINSPGHLRNIVGNFNLLGVGRAVDEGEDRVYWATIFGA